MRKPKIFDDFGISNKEGLSTYLSGNQEDVDKVIQKTAYQNLDVIVSGPIPPNPAELLITQKFESLIDLMKDRYDMVVLDTPPVGLVSETLDLIRLADISLFVVRYNYSDKQFIDHINSLKQQEILKDAYIILMAWIKKPKNMAMAQVMVMAMVMATGMVIMMRITVKVISSKGCSIGNCYTFFSTK